MQTEKKKVLIVEDNPGDARILKETLGKFTKGEFELIHEESLQGSLKRLSEEEMEIIFLDLFLPDAFGLEGLEKIRAADPLTPIILLTCLNDEAVFGRAMDLGAQLCLVKDRMDGETLLEILRYAVEQERNLHPGELARSGGERLLDAQIWLEAKKTHGITRPPRNGEEDLNVFLEGSPVDLKEIIANERVKAYFQPWVSLKKQLVLGFEGLCRGIGQGPDNLIPPTTLLNVAENHKLLNALDRAFRKKALDSFAPVARENPELVLSLNFDSSVLNKDKEDFNGFISMVRERGLDPGHIAIEILGSHLCGAIQLEEFIEAQRSFGFLIALDHIGLGYPHLDLIGELKPDLLKTDRSLIVDIDKNYHKRETLRFMVKLAHGIGALLIAEGLENEQEAMTTLTLGVDMIQGFYVSEPRTINKGFLAGYQDRIQEITKKFKNHIIQDIGLKNSHYRQYDQLAYLMSRELSSATPETLHSILFEIIRRYSEVQCLYVLDKAGIQVSRTVVHDSTPYVNNVFFKFAAVGTDHSLKDYYYCLIDGDLKAYTFASAPYLSLGTGKLCITLSTLFKNAKGQTQILCADIKQEDSALENRN